MPKGRMKSRALLGKISPLTSDPFWRRIIENLSVMELINSEGRGMGQIVLDAKNTVDIKGIAGITAESPANTTVKGSAMVTIQGGMVKIN